MSRTRKTEQKRHARQLWQAALLAVEAAKQSIPVVSDDSDSAEDSEDPAPTSSPLDIEPVLTSIQASVGALLQADKPPSSGSASSSSRDQGIRDKAIFDGATLQAFENVINEDLLELPDFIRMNAMQGIDNGSEEEWALILRDYNAQGSHAANMAAEQAARFTARPLATVGNKVHQQQILGDCERMLASLGKQTAVDAWLQGMVLKVVDAFLARRWYAQTTHHSDFARRQGDPGMDTYGFWRGARCVRPDRPEAVFEGNRQSCAEHSSGDDPPYQIVARLRPVWCHGVPRSALGAQQLQKQGFCPHSSPAAPQAVQEDQKQDEEEHPLALGNLGAEWAIIHIVSALDPEQGAESPAAKFIRNCLAELRHGEPAIHLDAGFRTTKGLTLSCPKRNLKNRKNPTIIRTKKPTSWNRPRQKPMLAIYPPPRTLVLIYARADELCEEQEDDADDDDDEETCEDADDEEDSHDAQEAATQAEDGDDNGGEHDEDNGVD
ncbi:hypothetical protein C8J57DRAFT_1506282 [Mycena rebaudengoi]|nr:hypothetical protein C8J57DRAFT_1506282 [Mycena rebaudengoi]